MMATYGEQLQQDDEYSQAEHGGLLAQSNTSEDPTATTTTTNQNTSLAASQTAASGNASSSSSSSTATEEAAVENSSSSSSEAPSRRKRYSVMIEVLVPDESRDYYMNEWMVSMYTLMQGFKGFIRREVHELPSRNGMHVFFVVLVFDSLASFQTWSVADERKERIEHLKRHGCMVKLLNSYGDGSNTSTNTSTSTSGAEPGAGGGGAGGGGGGGVHADEEECNEKQFSSRLSIQNTLSKPPPPRPPPKWKISLILVFGVYSTVSVTGIGGSAVGMTKRGFPFSLIIFLSVCQVVLLLSYALLPLIMSVPIVSRWLKAHRPPALEMSPLEALFDQGLQIFAKLPAAAVPQEIISRLEKLEARVDILRTANHKLRSQVASSSSSSSSTIVNASTNSNSYSSTSNATNADAASSVAHKRGEVSGLTPTKSPPSSSVINSNDLDAEQKVHGKSLVAMARQQSLSRQQSYQQHRQQQQDPTTAAKAGAGRVSQYTNAAPAEPLFVAGEDAYITTAVRHFVRWERVDDFEQWTNDMEKLMQRHTGFMGMLKIAPLKDGDPFVNTFTFSSFENVLKFLESTERFELLKELEPMLAATSVASISEERYVSNTFSELFVATGGHAANRPPPVWKTAILTIIPLFIVVWQIGSNLHPFFIDSGIPEPVVSLIITTINVSFTNYIGVPLVHAQFGDWLAAPRPVHPLPYIGFLDTGIPNKWVKILLVCVYYGLNLGLGFGNS